MRAPWPWLVLASLLVPAVWHVVDFPDDPDGESPEVRRPTFSPLPPPAYRLAEPGDTLDRVAIYASSACVVVAGCGLARRRPVGAWPSALALSIAAWWSASTPSPTFDGWHGLGWSNLGSASAPPGLRLGLGIGVCGLVVIICRYRDFATAGIRRFDLLAAAAILVAPKLVGLAGPAPAGYWPRWAFDAGLIALGLSLAIGLPSPPRSARARSMVVGAIAAGWVILVLAGIQVSWLHRPLNRLRTVVPGRIYLSAMPTYRGLEIAHARHGFKTIVNLFPEDTPQRSPRWPDEQRFARERGIRLVAATSADKDSAAFLDATLAIARDPAAWPILVHCHGSMDRSPAWMGLYRFLEQGVPLGEVLREIEGHRGYRPKASVTLLYDRVLTRLAPERYRADPDGRVLHACAAAASPPTLTDTPRSLELPRAGASMPPTTTNR